MSTTITLHNDFHGTTARVRPVPITDGRHAGRHYVSRRVARRLRSALCGAADCTCGNAFGERPGLLDDAVVTEVRAGCVVEGYVLDLSRLDDVEWDYVTDEARETEG